MTKCFWVSFIDRIRDRVGKPRGMRVADERLLTDCIKIAPSEGVTIQSMEVIAVGRRPCPGHHWHKVKASSLHISMIAKAFVGFKIIHDDFVCCKCTFGKCSINGQ